MTPDDHPEKIPENIPLPPELAALEFQITCAMRHHGIPCARPATHTALVHDCTSRAGFVRVPICGYSIAAAKVISYPTVCRCGKPVHRQEDYMHTVEPL